MRSKKVQKISTLSQNVFPGCDNNDFIHDDLRLDNIIAHQTIDQYGITSARFSFQNRNLLQDDDYVLFPSFVNGYVLNSRVWAKLDLDLATDVQSTGKKFDALQLLEGHKESLKALVDIGESPRTSNRLSLDVMPEKGQGVILLHGKPGLGKTATAEAITADLNRLLYPITYADLGEGPGAIETSLKRSFAMVKNGTVFYCSMKPTCFSWTVTTMMSREIAS